MPAFERAFAEHDAEIAAVTAQAEAPTFGNTIEALERSGKLLDRVSGVFFNLASADTNDALLAIEREIGPKLAAHSNRILQNDALFQRIDALYRARDTAGLNRRAAPRARPLSQDVPAGRRRPRRRHQGAAGRDRASGWRCSGRASARTCSPTSRTTR